MGIQQPNILKLISSDAINMNLEIKSVACNQSALVKRKDDSHLDDCVEEDQGDDEPEHELGLADVSDSAPVLSVPPKKRKH